MARTLEISDESYEKIKSQLLEEEKVNISSLQDMIGKSFFFRTVTYHIIGKVEKIIGNILELSTASWVADSGRFADAIKKGTLNEVEPLGSWYVNIQSVTDFGIWKHKLPIEQK
jgi:hypothetical protein